MAAAGAKKKDEDTDAVPETGALGTEPVTTSFDATETPATPVASVDPVNPDPLAPGEAGVVTEQVYPEEGGRSGV